MSNRALIVVDVQQDFCEGGALAVPGGAAVAAAIAAYLRAATDYRLGVATRDHHDVDSDNDGHFASGAADPDYSTTWPTHCVAGTAGADLHPEFSDVEHLVHAYVHKGQGRAAYSGFEGVTADADLATLLRQHGIEQVDVVGLATDHCVRATALDAAALGFATTVVTDLCAGVDADTTRAALIELAQAGVSVRETGTPALN